MVMQLPSSRTGDRQTKGNRGEKGRRNFRPCAAAALILAAMLILSLWQIVKLRRMLSETEEDAVKLRRMLFDPEHLAHHIKEHFLCRLPSDAACGTADDSFRRFERAGVHVLPVHFYSIVPEVGSLDRAKFERPEVSPATHELCSQNPRTCPVPALPGINLNVRGQIEGMSACEALRPEFEEIPSSPVAGVFHSRWACSQYTPADQPCTPFGAIDGQVYHCFVRGATGWQGGKQPSKIIEVGSGHSTYMAAGAMAYNKKLPSPSWMLMSIEPYPSAELRQGFKGVSFNLMEQKLQDIDLEVFRGLGAGDILFIDSTHVAVPGSDVVYIVTQILPQLGPGVIVHVHDICLPFETAWDWTFKDYRFWNEQYLLQAFLIDNDEWEVLYMGIMWQHFFPDLLAKLFPLKGSNGSFWMRKKERPKSS